MRDLLADAIEATGVLIAQAAKNFASVIGRDFTEEESAAYLRFAGADALAESLGRMESDGPDAADAWLPLRSEKVGSFGYREFFPTPAAHGVAADGPSAACDIPPSPAEGHVTRKSDVCKHCARPIELVIDTHPQYGRAGVWLHVGGDGRCRSTYASPQ